MFQVDRIAAIIRPTEKMITWIKKHAALEPQKDCTVLLIPQFEGPSRANAYIKGMAQAIFEGELASWDIDAKLWPADRSYNAFTQCFTVEYHSFVCDLVLLEAHLAEMC